VANECRRLWQVIRFVRPSVRRGQLDGALDDGLVQVVATEAIFALRTLVLVAAASGEHELPGPLPRRIGRLPLERPGQRHLAPAFGKITLVHPAHPLEMRLELRHGRAGKHGSPGPCRPSPGARRSRPSRSPGP